jgi:hypothetical protein
MQVGKQEVLPSVPESPRRGQAQVFDDTFQGKDWLHQWNVDLSANTFSFNDFVHNTVNVTQASLPRRILGDAFTCSSFLLSFYPLFDGRFLVYHNISFDIRFCIAKAVTD